MAVTNISLMGMMLCQEINLETQSHTPQKPDWGIPASPIVLDDNLKAQIAEAGGPVLVKLVPFFLLLVVCGGQPNEEFTVNVRLGEAGPDDTVFETRQMTWPPQQSWFPIVFPVNIGVMVEDDAFLAFAVLINGIPMGRVVMPLIWQSDFKRPPQPTQD